ncbi:MAG: protein kinase [Labilithrix sp.]|nr:protein kinase [Labilithrix sp.]
MGIIHLASLRGPGGFSKLCVVKELKPELAEDPAYAAMFLEEARLAARLRHRHIVQTNEVGCHDGRYFMALELLEGGSLHDVRKKLGPGALPRNLALRVVAAVCDALHHAHELEADDGTPLGIVHRDVSPQNVFLTFDGDVKLIDFGVAKSGDRAEQARTRVGVVKGSVPYMSPDHVDGSAIDRRADVFAAGILLRELLTGERLWGDADDLTMLRRLIARDVPPLPPQRLAALGPRLATILRRAMAPRREDRYATAALLRDALLAHAAEADPRGSLAELGPWLTRSLATERAAFRELVKRQERGLANVWLPSSDLRTRVSGVPASPPVPAPEAPRATGERRGRAVLASVMFAGGLLLAGLGLAHPHAAATLLGETRAPRVVEDVAPSTLVTAAAASEAAVTAAVDEDDARARALTASAEALAEASPAAGASVPASIANAALPANPYAATE